MFVILLIVIIVLIAKCMNDKHKVLKKIHVNHIEPTPLFGNWYGLIRRKEHITASNDRAYRKFSNDRLVGIFEFLTPVYLIRDINLLKQIGVKDFDHFSEHRQFSNEQDPFLPKSLMGMKSEKWRAMRSTLSPAFTAAKLRNMVPFIQECSKNLEIYLTEKAKNEGSITIDTKDVIAKYSNDVIATCAFGIKLNSISDSNNEFYKMGVLFTTMSVKRILKFVIASRLPLIQRMLNIDVFPMEAINFFRRIFLGTIKKREEENIYRPDMLHLLKEAQKGTLTHDTGTSNEEEMASGFATAVESHIGKSTVKHVWDDTHIVAQAMLFFFGGFDTVSTAIVFLLHELAVNQDIQKRLQDEIDDNLLRCNGKLDYDKINKMKYLDMCVSESLRKWPPITFMDRLCVKKYNAGKPNENAPDLIMKPGDTVVIPLLSIHRDEKYYQEPEKFDPERFSDENKQNIKQFTYIPFGIGPRNCIGSRFALAELKTVITGILENFNVLPSSSTQLPLRLGLDNIFNTRLHGGHKLTFQLRNKSK